MPIGLPPAFPNCSPFQELGAAYARTRFVTATQSKCGRKFAANERAANRASSCLSDMQPNRSEGRPRAGPNSASCELDSLEVSHKKISERRPKRELRRGAAGSKQAPVDQRQQGQVMSCCFIYSLLLMQVHALLLAAASARATSQISSIWVPREERDLPAAGTKLNFHATSAGIGANSSQLAAGEPKAQQRLQAPRASLQTSASSLLPAIAAAEPEERPLETRTPQRRSSVFPSGPQFRLAHVDANQTDEAALEQLWTGANQGRPSLPSNSQVHFDEEHQPQRQPAQHSRKRQLIPKPLEDSDSERRQAEGEAQQAPRTGAGAFPSSFAAQFDEPPGEKGGQRFNESRAAAAHDDDELDDSMAPGNRAFGHQGTFRPHNEPLGSPGAGGPFLAADERDQRFAHGADGRRSPVNFSSPPDFRTFYSVPGTQPQNSPAGPPPSPLSYGFSPRAPELTGGRYSVATTTQAPADIQTLAPDSSLSAQMSFKPIATTRPPLVYNPRRAATALPKSLHQILNGAQLGHFAPLQASQQPARRSRPRPQAVLVGEFPSQGSRAFLRGFNPAQQQAGGYSRPKKSLLSAINAKLNNWSADSSLQNVDELRLLEQAFFDRQQDRSRAPQRPQRAPQPTAVPFARTVRPLYSASTLGFGQDARGTLTLERPAFYGPIRQPTVAPVSSALNHFYGTGPSARPRRQFPRDRPGAIQQQGSQQAASFIPVVAVQVTRTSPAPADSLAHQPLADQFAPAASSGGLRGDLDEYLAAKTGLLGKREPGGPKWDDSFGGYATGSRQVDTLSPHHTHRAGQLNETTVMRGAVFGYLPHQADTPLLQAMNMLQQLTPAQQRVQELATAGLARHPGRSDSTHQFAGYPASSGEIYANQMDKSSQSADAATSLLDYHTASALPTARAQSPQPSGASHFVDEQPSLGLQLQANSFAQNPIDIVHPFGANSRSNGLQFERGARSGQQHARPLEVAYPSDQMNFAGLQLLTGPLGQAGAPFSEQFGAGQFGQQAASEQQEAFQAFGQTAGGPLSASPQLLAAAANDMSPLLAGAVSPLFLQSAHQFHLGDPFLEQLHKLQPGDQQRQQQFEGGQESASSESAAASNPQNVHDTASSDTIDTAHRNQPLNNKGRKRSSEFFASAGQLLLSALPLLLAPTLGLMFAAAPSIPAARYHGLGQIPASAGGPAHFGGGSHLSGGHEEGVVVNASPAPQMFTPTPPGHSRVQSVEEARRTESASSSRPSLLVAEETVRPSTTTSRPRVSHFKTAASLPALTGIRASPTPAGSRRSTRAPFLNRTTTAKPFTVILTTIGPPQLNLSASVQNLSLVAAGGGVDGPELANKSAAPELGGSSVTLTTPTLLLLEATPDDSSLETGGDEASVASADQQNTTELRRESQREAASERRRQEQIVGQLSEVLVDGSLRPLPTAAPSSVAYNIGYEGADFDAQFPALRRPGTTSGPALNKFVKNKSHYQYAEVPLNDSATPAQYEFALATPTRGPQVHASGESDSRRGTADRPRRPPQADDYELSEGDDAYYSTASKLYPVSTWPPKRRRVVSLLTRAGNRTIVDSSDRYVNGMPISRRSATRRKGSEGSSLIAGPQMEDERAPLPSALSRQRQREARLPGLVQQTNARLDVSAIDEHAPLASGRKLSTLDSFLLESSSGGNQIVRRRKRSAEPAGSRNNTKAIVSEGLARAVGGGRPVKLLRGHREKASVKRKKETKKLGASPQRRQDGDAHLLEPLEGDASKSKSAIMTAMVAHMASGDAQDGEQEDRARDGQRADGDEPEETAEDSQEEAREQLLDRKAFLERLASRASALEEFPRGQHDDDNFQAGGRGRFKAAPVVDYLPALEPPQRNYSATRFVNNRARAQARGSIDSSVRSALELTEDTKRALAKFGSLLLEDTLQIPPTKNESRTGARKRSSGRTRYADYSRGGPPEQADGSATERYTIRVTTQTPPAGLDQGEWARYYPARNLSAANFSETGELLYQYPPSRARNQTRQHQREELANEHPASNSTELERGDFTRTNRLHGRAYTPPAQLQPGLYGSQAIAFKPASEAPLNRYNSHTSDGHYYANRTAAPANQTSEHYAPNATLEQPDARYAGYPLYQPYSTAPPPPSAADYNPYYERDAQTSRRREYHHHSPHSLPPGYLSNEEHVQAPRGYAHEQPLQYYSGSPNSSYGGPSPPPPPPPPPQPPIGPSYRQQASSAHQQTAFPHPSPGALDEFAGAPPPPSNYGRSRVPPTKYPAYEPQQGHFSNSFAGEGFSPEGRHLHQHQPSSSTYAPSPSAPGAQQAFGAGRNSPPLVVHSADSTRAVNEYLKRVQFSDSDRDKLMASYLTCDGLLNDSDHCLERLSCEFSDPKNIERANKLDRAVSSILLGHILINTYIPSAFKLRLKSASLFGYTQSGKCSKFACSKLTRRSSAPAQEAGLNALDDFESKVNLDR